MEAIAVWFVQKPSEYFAFVGRMVQIQVMQGHTFGLGAITQNKLTEQRSEPGLYLQYSDNSFRRFGDCNV